MAAKNAPRRLELLAPARDAATALVAIAHGADAVYMGAPAFGARAAAVNSIEDIRRVVEAAAPFGVKVYVTVNTIIYDSELDDVARMIAELYAAGVEALIVQDTALLSLPIPPIDLHASTQCDSRTPEKIRNLSAAGFSQIVVPREFSLGQIRQASEAAGDAAIEVFVHGALCVSYSGDCQAGYVLTGRSANRGECPQICRLKFKLCDADGEPIKTMPDGGSNERHWLSIADLNRLDNLKALAEAGASSFKIEGRLKSAAYVKNVVAAYSQALDKLVAESDGAYIRASYGRVDLNFTPDPQRSFNRGFTKYFLRQVDRVGLASWRTPKWVGRPAGKVVEVCGRYLRINPSCELRNGDGLGWFDRGGEFVGFRVNRVEGDRIYPAPGSNIPSVVGVELYRNSDSEFESLMARADTAHRTVGVSIVLRRLTDGRIAIDATDERGCSVSVASETKYNDVARTSQEQPRRNILSRMGDTIYRLDSLDDRLEDLFVPSSAMADLRREALARLDRAWRIARRPAQRRPNKLAADAFVGLATTYHDNVANHLARNFYEEHGASIGETAIETSCPDGEVRVMTTRYCLRRELGACLRTGNASKLPMGSLQLMAPIGKLRVAFDCANCQMHIYSKPKNNNI